MFFAYFLVFAALAYWIAKLLAGLFWPDASGKLTGSELTDDETGKTEDLAEIADNYAQTWSAYLGTDKAWMAYHLDDTEDEAYDEGAPFNWEKIGWPTPVGPGEDRFRYAGPTLRAYLAGKPK